MITGFAIAVLANVWRRNWGYALVLAGAIVEAVERYRFELHGWVRDAMLGLQPPPGAKEILQSKLIYVAGMLLLALLLLLLPYLVRANAGRRMMVLGTFMGLIVLALELISPHRIDRIIYHTIGLFALSAIVYFVGAILIAWGAILDRRPEAGGSRIA
jgi:hypothetical protein